MRFLSKPMSIAAMVLVALATARGADEPSRIDQVLARWETQAAGWKTLNVRFTREDHEVAENTQTFKGALLVKDAETAAVDFAKPGEPPTLVERLVWTGSEVRQFDAKTKQIWFFPRPKDIPPKLPDAICLPFLFGRKAAELKEHYDIRLAKEDEKSYLIRFDAKDIAAATPAKGNLLVRTLAKTIWLPSTFRTAHVELDKETLLPRKLLLVDLDGKDTHTYSVTSIRLNEPVREDIFQVRAVKGWKVIVNPASAD